MYSNNTFKRERKSREMVENLLLAVVLSEDFET